jgi:DNA-binding NtrC family response regulator
LFPDGLLAGREIKDLRRELESAYLLRLFRETGGKIPKLLERLGIRRSNFYTWLRKVGLDVEEMRRRL